MTAGYYIAPWVTAPEGGDLDGQARAIVAALGGALEARGTTLRTMVKHTIVVRAGACDPIAAIHAFHRACHDVAPALRDAPSVGTIVMSPDLGAPDAVIALFALFMTDESAFDGARRLLFDDMPMDVAKGIRIGRQIFLTGLEALELTGGEDRYHVAPDFPAQADVVARKVLEVLEVLERLDARFEDLIALNLYLHTPMDDAEAVAEVAAAFSRMLARAVSLPPLQIIRGLGMAIPAFLLEIDGYALVPGADEADPIAPLAVAVAAIGACETRVDATLAALDAAATDCSGGAVVGMTVTWPDHGAATNARDRQQVVLALAKGSPSLPPPGFVVGVGQTASVALVRSL